MKQMNNNTSTSTSNTKNTINMINQMVDLFDEAVMSLYYGLIDENKENTAITNYDKEKGRLNYYECLMQIIDYFLSDRPLNVDDEVKSKIDKALNTFQHLASQNTINTEEIRKALLLLDIKAFKNINFPLDLITPDATSLLIANLVDALIDHKKRVEILDFNFGVGNLIYTICNHIDASFKITGFDNHSLLANVAIHKSNMLMQSSNIFYQDALEVLPNDIDIIVSDLACYDYENQAYHSYLYDKGVKYFPYLAIEHYLKISKPLFAIYLIENTFFQKEGSQAFYEMLKANGHIDLLVTLPTSFFQRPQDTKSIMVVSNQVLNDASTNVFILPALSKQDEFKTKLDEITKCLKNSKQQLITKNVH